ncbi:MAG: hypothetical protein ACK4K1_02325 [Flavobacterium sp.]
MDTFIIKVDPTKTKALTEMFKAFEISYELKKGYLIEETVLHAEEPVKLTLEQKKAIDEALDDVANERVHSHEEAMEILKKRHPKYF